MYVSGQPVAVKTLGDKSYRLVLFDVDAFDGFFHARPVDSVVDGRELVAYDDSQGWNCLVHGHVVPLYVDGFVANGGEGDDSAQEIGACSACKRRQTRPKKLHRAIACGTCNDTGWVQDLHQRSIGSRGTVPCPTCFSLDADR